MMSNAVNLSVGKNVVERMLSPLITTMAISWSGTGTALAKTAPESLLDLAEKLLPSVVNISTTQTVEGRERPTMPQLPPARRSRSSAEPTIAIARGSVRDGDFVSSGWTGRLRGDQQLRNRRCG